MLKKTLVCGLVFFFLFVGNPLIAQEQETEEYDEPEVGGSYPVNFSLYYPVSLNKSKYDRVNFNLGVIYSHYGYLKGIDLSGLASVVSRDMLGIQIAGLGAVAGESGQGIQMSGLASVAGSTFTGLQTSGLFCVVGEEGTVFQSSGLFSVIGSRGKGFQSAGLGCVTGETFSGAQISGGFNVIGNEGRAFQAAGLMNVSGGSLLGVQVAGLLNVCGDVLTGLQVGTFNVAVHSCGLQIGVANVGETSKGVQIGLVNYTKEENEGVPIGLVNLARNGRIRGVFWGGSAVAVSGGVKFSVNRFYSILSLGAINFQDGITESIIYGAHYGYAFPLDRLFIGLDAGYRFRDNSTLFKSTAENPDEHLCEVRLSLGIPLSERFTLLVGGGFFSVNRTHDDKGFLPFKPMILAGFEF
ncbi:MAG: hypothetical protein KKD56_09570 [Acidobacteria bacterium]|nr:hypothetical protein [Acidobacteriota bacterium]MBU1475396.1 hypothetical protein [Acidobacteriota bacterium]MBU2438725.1 hypothetical protein [Acidobacteriota bacterium]